MLKSVHGEGGPFLCGDFGIVDAMFAPVAVRFTGYGVAMDDTARTFVDAIYTLPAFQQWHASALAEPRPELQQRETQQAMPASGTP